MAVLTVTWHTHIDERTCPVCYPLDGRQWSYDTETDMFPEYLYGKGGEIVWSMQANEPRTHGEHSRRGPWNCRCTITIDIDVSNETEILHELNGTVHDFRDELFEGIGEYMV